MASFAGSEDYASAQSAPVTFQIAKATPTIRWLTPAAITYGTALGGTQLDATAFWTVGGTLGSVAGTFVYTPEAGTVLKANANPQTLSVIFTPADTTDYTTATQTTTIQVNPATPTIQWPTPSAITYGTALGSTQLDATASWTVGGTLGSVAGTFAYTPNAGAVLAAGNHTLSVTFTPTDTTDYTTATQTTTIQVNPATPTIRWSTPAAITYGTALGGTQLDATASWTVGGTLGSVAGTFAYTPNAGAVLAAGNHTLSVTFTPTDTTDYTTATQTTTIQVNPATPTIRWSTPAAITYGTALGGTQLDATASWTMGGTSGSVSGTFTYRPGPGTVLRANPKLQTLSVTFTPTDTMDYTVATQTTTIQVNPATPAIRWPTPAAITYGTALGSTQWDAAASWTVGGTSGSVAGTFAYAPGTGAVLKANSKPQTLSVTFTPTDTTDYTAATQTTTIQVNRATPTIRWPTPAAITYGTALGSTQLDAAASWTVGGTPRSVAGAFAYTPKAKTVLAAGDRTLSVTFTPTDTTDYTAATQTTSINVNRATPAIVVAGVTVTNGGKSNGYSVTYDASPHVATGVAKGVGGVDLSSELKLTGTAHVNAGSYTDDWEFTDTTGNYNNASGTVTDTIVGPVNLSKSTIAAMPASIAPGGTATVTLTALDVYGDQELSGGLNVAFAVSGSAGGKIGAVTDNKNGTYTAKFTAGTKVGNETITATIGGKATTAKATVTVVAVTSRAAGLSKSGIALWPSWTASGNTATVTTAALPISRSLSEPSTNAGVNAALRTLLLDESTVAGKLHPFCEP